MSLLLVYLSKRCIVVALGCVFVCQVLYSSWLILYQDDMIIPSELLEKNGVSLSLGKATGSLNKTLDITRQLSTIGPSDTLTQRTPASKWKVRRSPVPVHDYDRGLVMPDVDNGGYVDQKRLAIKNVPLQMSDADRKGPVMPVPLMHYRGQTQLAGALSRNEAMEIVSSIFSASSSKTTSPPQDIIEHFQSHTKRMAQFCIKHNYSGELPQDEYTQQELYHHLLYDDSKRIIFCYVPKSGCSNWKRMFAVLNGTVDADDTERPSKAVLQNVNKLEYLSEEERNKRLKQYFKFSFVRNPLERLVSSYRNKIAVPIDYANRNHWPDRILYQIIKKYEKVKYYAWSKTNFTSPDFYPSFEAFVHYLATVKLDILNEHFRPFMELCQPCAVNYNFIGNFYNLPDEAYRIMDFLGIQRSYYLNRIEHPSTNTSSIVSLHYDTITDELKLQFLQKFSHELLMYYQLYPSECKKDVAMLGLTQYLKR